MKECPKCGTFMDDKELACPECGTTMVTRTSNSSLSLKSGDEPEKKKKSNPMGTTMSTGSGLTDILRSENDEEVEVDDDFYGGSIPVSMARNNIDGDYSAKKKSTVLPSLIKIAFLVAIVIGVYMFVTKVVLKETRTRSREDAINIYIEAMKGGEDELGEIVPPYEDEDHFRESTFLEYQGRVTTHNIKNVDFLNKDDVDTLNVNLKLATGKTVKIDEACNVEIEVMTDVKPITLNLTFVKIRNDWYMNPDNILK